VRLLLAHDISTLVTFIAQMLMAYDTSRPESCHVANCESKLKYCDSENMDEIKHFEYNC